MKLTEVELAPIPELHSEIEAIEAEISRVLLRELYRPLLDVMGVEAKERVLENALNVLVRAIQDGRISFHRGEFKGRFSGAISRELRKIGAKWDRRTRTFKIPLSSLPPDIEGAVRSAESRFVKMLQNLDRKLQDLLPEKIAEKLNLESLFSTAMFRVEKSFKQTIKNISVAPDITPTRLKDMAREYTNNMQLDIKEWSEREIKRLRLKVKDAALSGQRFETMVKHIEKSYGVSQTKAKFLARQETNLALAKYKTSRYSEAGIKQYRWYCAAGSPDHPVRDMHKALEGKVFSWDNPPVTDDRGNRNNPGEDFNCRCFARPIVRFTDESDAD